MMSSYKVTDSKKIEPCPELVEIKNSASNFLSCGPNSKISKKQKLTKNNVDQNNVSTNQFSTNSNSEKFNSEKNNKFPKNKEKILLSYCFFESVVQFVRGFSFNPIYSLIGF